MTEEIELSNKEKKEAWEWRNKKYLNASEKDIHFVRALFKMFDGD